MRSDDGNNKMILDDEEIKSITSGPRQSNFELLRIVAMFLVLLTHANFWTLGNPALADFYQNPVNSWLRTIFECMSIICVNVFILISGWFGIKTSIEGFFNFVFQCLFFGVLIYVVMLGIGQTSPNVKGILGCFYLTQVNWFVKAYVALYLLSPVLNKFVEHTTKNKFLVILSGLFLFQSLYGWSGAARFIENGFSAFSFICLYLLARYIRFYPPLCVATISE